MERPFCLSIHPSTDSWAALAIVNNAVVNVSVTISLWDPAFNSFGDTEVRLLDPNLIFWGPTILFSQWPYHLTSISGPFCTCYSKGSSEPTCVLFALLQLHVANPDNLAHEADAGSDEVCAAEVLQGQREQKRMSPYITLSHSFLFSFHSTIKHRSEHTS